MKASRWSRLFGVEVAGVLFLVNPHEPSSDELAIPHVDAANISISDKGRWVEPTCPALAVTRGDGESGKIGGSHAGAPHVQEGPLAVKCRF